MELNYDGKMELNYDSNGFWWREGYATSQDFPTAEAAQAALEAERKAQAAAGLEVDGLAGAGVLIWSY